MSNTNLNLYKSFLAVYEAKSMRRAAESLDLAHTSVLQNIKELSNQLDVKLFTSHSKGVEPTDDAHRLYPTIKEAIKSISTIEQHLGDTKQQTIKIAIANNVAEILTRKFIKHFYQKNPNVQIEISKLDSLNAFKQKQLDFIIDLSAAFNNTEYKTINIMPVTASFIATKDFLQKNNLESVITKEKLFQYPIITRPEIWNGTNPSIIKTTSADMTYNLTKDSVGIGYFAHEILDRTLDTDMVVLDVSDIVPTKFQLVCGYCRPLSKIAKTFTEEFVHFAKSAYTSS